MFHYHQVAAAILAVVHRRALKKRPAAQAFAQALQHLRVGFGALQQARRAPQQLLLGVPRHAAKRRVAVSDARPFAIQRGIGDDHGIESLRHGRVQQLRQVGASGAGRGWQRGHKGGCFTRRGDRVGLQAYQAWPDSPCWPGFPRRGTALVCMRLRHNPPPCWPTYSNAFC